jgi:hypothetical protein
MQDPTVIMPQPNRYGPNPIPIAHIGSDGWPASSSFSHQVTAAVQHPWRSCGSDTQTRVLLLHSLIRNALLVVRITTKVQGGDSPLIQMQQRFPRWHTYLRRHIASGQEFVSLRSSTLPEDHAQPATARLHGGDH